MKIYYFDTRDGVPIRDRHGREFASSLAAIEHSKELAKKVRGERRKNNRDLCIVVIDESGSEIHREPVYPHAT